MPDYDLNRLGSRAFEQMIVALGRLEIGPGVQVFGDGPDGGREATYTATINWSATSTGVSDRIDAWTRYVVLQSKFQIKPKPEPRDNAVWLQGEISREVARWIKVVAERTRSRLPDYLIFVTNVDLTAVAEAGGIDTINSFIAKKINEKETRDSGLHVKGFVIWHADPSPRCSSWSRPHCPSNRPAPPPWCTATGGRWRSRPGQVDPQPAGRAGVPRCHAPGGRSWPLAREVVDGTVAALERLGLGVPSNRRWPVRVDLAKCAEEISTGTETTLLRWISTMIQKRTEQDIQPVQLREWLRTWPWALILDGLDEVPSAAARRMLYRQIGSTGMFTTRSGAAMPYARLNPDTAPAPPTRQDGPGPGTGRSSCCCPSGPAAIVGCGPSGVGWGAGTGWGERPRSLRAASW
ncbi:hypothetical protein [Micromonospora thermarum]|uniref:Uncharacterized protein n=1 Tax=Micromonospora thermarum TaxID=2720024 RepID=A0ABX0Z859_9ACTN|nr:hypothetical protein [Micromonospora thermarum]NJP32584.1 hypothetical protein [Micromonospora thermarum]